ncbi:MAG: YVTN family beta-propeller repeat protein [Bacteroidales bacterium]
MKRNIKLISVILLFSLLIAFTVIFYHKWGRKHVNYYTAVTDHPINCISCHLYTIRKGPVAKILNETYLSPLNLAVSKDGNKIYIVAQESGEMIRVDTRSGKVDGKVRVGKMPHSIVLSGDEKFAYVSNLWSDLISVVDLTRLAIADELKVGNAPAGLALIDNGRYLFAVNSFSNDISVIDLSSGTEIKRLQAGNNPTGISVSPGDTLLIVTSRRALIAPYTSPLFTEVTEVDADSKMVTKHRNIRNAYMIENSAFTPEGDMILITLIRPKNYVPSIQIERGWMMTEGIGVILPGKEECCYQLLLDEPNSFYSDPFDIIITPDGKRAFVSHSGVNCISVISIDSLRAVVSEIRPGAEEWYANYLGASRRFVIKRIQTGACPKGMALSPDGRILYVAEHLEDKIAVINTETLEYAGTIDLRGPERITVARQGRRLLNNAGHTFQNQYSCYTCHPDVHEDGLVYNMASRDMGRNVTNTQSLRNIGHTAPFKWNGLNQSLYKQDGMRFSTVLTRTEAFSFKELDALVSYIVTGIKNPPNLVYNHDGNLTPAQLRGKAIFERTHDSHGNEIPIVNRCVTCHPAPYYTNRKAVDVGTLSPTDDSILFDTPHLNNVFASPPYLHDGRAATLEEIWTIYGRDENHGAVNDLTKIELNDLIEFLKSLRDPDYESNIKNHRKILKSEI